MSSQILGLFVPSITLILAGAFAALWLRMRDARHVLAFSGTYMLVGLGFLLFHYAAAPTNIPAMIAVHTLYSVAGIMMFWGLYHRVGLYAPIRLFAVIQAITAVLMSVSIVGDDMRPWLYSANVGHGLIFALAARDLMQLGIRTSIDKVIVWVVGICSAMFFARPVLSIIVTQRMTVEVYKSSDYYALLMVAVGVLTLALAMSIVAAVLQDQMSMVREDSENDHLTGLKMRRAFEQSAMDMIDRGTRKNVPVSMIVADIDHFKQVNDIWGHQSGDRAIVAFGKLIQRMVRADDVCGRIGGEEFCIMIWNCELDPAERLAERVREAFAAMPHDGINSDVRLTASFGVATCRPQEGFGKLFARADAALYRAKEAGRNQVLADRREEKREPMAENAAAALATDEAA
ncbi:GGDEF domain-containing protein [Altererythrobacter lutimaris]|uniref:diguanylate cyclase n=1 Tax=Altererythrobacter lutimaris TaxID=2743979 RepID=A0A850HHD8_9SPHN|nr:GGDEF domain-containing protein [Altererythrobacter lutimaris]